MVKNLYLPFSNFEAILLLRIYNSAQQTGFCDTSKRQVLRMQQMHTVSLLGVRPCSGCPRYSRGEDRQAPQWSSRRGKQITTWWLSGNGHREKENMEGGGGKWGKGRTAILHGWSKAQRRHLIRDRKKQGTLGWEVGEMGEGGQKVHASSYKFWGCNVQHSEYS